MKEWPEILQTKDSYSHFAIDLRTKKQREDCRLNRNTHTFNMVHEIWAEKPHLLHQEVGTCTGFKGQIEKIEYLETVVHIKALCQEKVDIDFYTDSEPFSLVSKF